MNTGSAAAPDALYLYVRQMGDGPLLTPAEERELARRKDAGDMEAKRRLIECNLRLVMAVARGYGNGAVPLSDLVQEGNIGLIRAVEKYDYRLGNRFSTYAMWWIRQAIARAIANQGRVIRLPVHVDEQVRGIARVRRELGQQLSREPSMTELAREAGFAERRTAALLELAEEPVSLESPVGDGESVLGDLIEDTNGGRPEPAAFARHQAHDLAAALARLEPRLRRVLAMRFGLGGETPRTLAEVGEELGVTRERARQLQAEALGELRRIAPELELYVRTE